MFAFFGIGTQEMIILLLVGALMFVVPVVAVALAVSLVRRSERSRGQDGGAEIRAEVKRLREEVERLKKEPA
jgi:hypothetical protein